MDYQEVKERIDRLLKAGGFPSDEPLDSIVRIVDSAQGPPPALEISSYSRVLASLGQWDRAEAVARAFNARPQK